MTTVYHCDAATCKNRNENRRCELDEITINPGGDCTDYEMNESTQEDDNHEV